MKQRLIGFIIVMVVSLWLFLTWYFRVEPGVYWEGAAQLIGPPLFVIFAVAAIVLSSESRLTRFAISVAAVAAGGLGYYWFVEVLPQANWINLAWALAGVLLLLVTIFTLVAVFMLVAKLDKHEGNASGMVNG